MSALQNLYKRGNLGYVEEVIMKVTNYAWSEMTLVEQGELREHAAQEITKLRARIAELEKQLADAAEMLLEERE